MREKERDDPFWRAYCSGQLLIVALRFRPFKCSQSRFARDGNLTPKGTVYAHNNYQTRLDKTCTRSHWICSTLRPTKRTGYNLFHACRWQSVRDAGPIYSNNSTFTISISYRLGSGYRLCVFRLDHDDVSKPLISYGYHSCHVINV